jgi:hypothetical protein
MPDYPDECLVGYACCSQLPIGMFVLAMDRQLLVLALLSPSLNFCFFLVFALDGKDTLKLEKCLYSCYIYHHIRPPLLKLMLSCVVCISMEELLIN